MRGYITDSHAASGLMLVDDLPEPEPAAHEAIVEVKAFSLNPGERKLVELRPNGWRPGQDIAGIVVRAASNGHGPAVGTRVTARVDWEGWSERVLVPIQRIACFDERVPFEEAATLPVAGLTALRALWQGGAIVGRHVLITGATGGVGQFAVQLAALSGAWVTAQVSSIDRVTQARELGAHEVVMSIDSTELDPFHLVLDGVGGSQLVNALHHVAPTGTVVLYGGAAGASELRLGDFYQSAHNGRIIGFISDAPEETIGQDLSILTRFLSEGRIRPKIDFLREWTAVPEAFELLGSRQIHGKAVFTVV